MLLVYYMVYIVCRLAVLLGRATHAAVGARDNRAREGRAAADKACPVHLLMVIHRPVLVKGGRCTSITRLFLNDVASPLDLVRSERLHEGLGCLGCLGALRRIGGALGVLLLGPAVVLSVSLLFRRCRCSCLTPLNLRRSLPLPVLNLVIDVVVLVASHLAAAEIVDALLLLVGLVHKGMKRLRGVLGKAVLGRGVHICRVEVKINVGSHVSPKCKCACICSVGEEY